MGWGVVGMICVFWVTGCTVSEKSRDEWPPSSLSEWWVQAYPVREQFHAAGHFCLGAPLAVTDWENITTDRIDSPTGEPIELFVDLPDVSGRWFTSVADNCRVVASSDGVSAGNGCEVDMVLVDDLEGNIVQENAGSFTQGAGYGWKLGFSAFNTDLDAYEHLVTFFLVNSVTGPGGCSANVLTEVSLRSTNLQTMSPNTSCTVAYNSASSDCAQISDWRYSVGSWRFTAQ